MGLEWDDTPASWWMGAKVYAEYAIHLANLSLRRTSAPSIPMPIARSIACNLERAVKALAGHFVPDETWNDTVVRFQNDIAPLLAEDTLENGRLRGHLPVSIVANAINTTKDLFAEVYAMRLSDLRIEHYAYHNPTTEKGFVEEWDRERYQSPEEDPDVVVTPWADAYRQVHRELKEVASFHWEKNETQVFAKIYFGGPYAGHSTGFVSDRDEYSVETEFELVNPGQDAQG